MTKLDALSLMCRCEDRASVLDIEFIVSGLPSGVPFDNWPSLVVALASLSGRLQRAANESELRQAVRQGQTSWEAGRLSDKQINEEIMQILQETDFCVRSMGGPAAVN